MGAPRGCLQEPARFIRTPRSKAKRLAFGLGECRARVQTTKKKLHHRSRSAGYPSRARFAGSRWQAGCRRRGRPCLRPPPRLPAPPSRAAMIGWSFASSVSVGIMRTPMLAARSAPASPVRCAHSPRCDSRSQPPSLPDHPTRKLACLCLQGAGQRMPFDPWQSRRYPVSTHRGGLLTSAGHRGADRNRRRSAWPRNSA
jgi:hypothetical protein